MSDVGIQGERFVIIDTQNPRFTVDMRYSYGSASEALHAAQHTPSSAVTKRAVVGVKFYATVITAVAPLELSASRRRPTRVVQDAQPALSGDVEMETIDGSV